MRSAEELLVLARGHQRRAKLALEAGDITAAVVWLGWAGEVAVDVLAHAMGTDPRRDHHRRATLARRAFEQQLVTCDVGSLLIRLHTERQRAVLEGTVPDLRGRTLEQAAEGIAILVEGAERVAAHCTSQPTPG